MGIAPSNVCRMQYLAGCLIFFSSKKTTTAGRMRGRESGVYARDWPAERYLGSTRHTINVRYMDVLVTDCRDTRALVLVIVSDFVHCSP